MLDSSVTDRSLEVPSEPIAIPADLRRKGLSAVINHLLDRQDDDSDDEKARSHCLLILLWQTAIANGSGSRRRVVMD